MTYEHIKALNIVMTAMMVPIGTFVGYSLGTGDLSKAGVALAIQTLFVFAQAHVWWRTAELIGTRSKL